MTVLSEAPARGTAAPASPRRRPHTAAAWLAAVAAGVTCFAYARSDLWLDEALTVNIARLPLGELRGALERDGAPPLYYALLHGWTAVFGDGDLAVRSLSGVFAAGALVAMWYAARRVGGAGLAWTAVVVMATNPFLARYATEARMYSLQVLLVTLGAVAVPRALARPAAGRLAAVAALAAALLYAQYWGFAVVGVVAAALVVVAWRDARARPAALRTLVAVAAGSATFVAWLPTFLSQRAHTGTPWGEPVLPGLPIGETFLGFSGGPEQEGWLLLLLAVPLVVLGVFGAAVDRYRVELDLRGRAEVRPHALVGGAVLVAGTGLAYLGGQAFQPRYAAVVLPFFVLLVARGVTTVADDRVRGALLTAVVLLGLVGGVRNMFEPRTQAGEVAAVLSAEAAPGDLVVYCPDQLGPAVHRLARTPARQVTFPDLADPAFVDWVDYEERVAAADPAAFARAALERAGPGTLWFVTGPGYRTHTGICEAVSDGFAAQRERIPRVLPDESVFEKPGLQQFPPASP